MTTADARDHGAEARQLIRRAGYAALATSFDGRPYVSLVACASDLDGSPLLLLSDLAQHTMNIRVDHRVSLLFDDTVGHPDPLAASRVTLLGRAKLFDDARAARRFTARHPSSAAYSGFADFRLYRIGVERAHKVAGFGRIAWIDAADLRFSADFRALADAEADILAHMTSGHGDAVQLYAERLLRRTGEGWQMVGIDPEGIDLVLGSEQGNERARLEFDQPVSTPEAAQRALVALAVAARNATL
jgi:putative heme iron utilization protein